MIDLRRFGLSRREVFERINSESDDEEGESKVGFRSLIWSLS